MLTTRVATGRPLLIAQAVDAGSGIDPLSIVLQYKRILLGASAYDPFTGIILFGIPNDAPKLSKGKTTGVLSVADFQEAKNINTPGDDIYPNTAFRPVRISAVAGPALTWVLPFSRGCADGKSDRLVVTASSTTKVNRVVFRADGVRVGVDRSGAAGIFAVTWNTSRLKKGVHKLSATAFDRSGRTDTAGRTVSVCR
jgi:hypothetical protein